LTTTWCVCPYLCRRVLCDQYLLVLVSLTSLFFLSISDQIPLAKKLRECGVFGVSCDEFLDYATDNRTEWEVKGAELVKQMLREAEDKLADREIAIDPADLSLFLREGGGAGGGVDADAFLLPEDCSMADTFDTRKRFL
jgi:hypothetical protein